MTTPDLVRIEMESKNSIICYRILGLNIFVSNTHREGRDLIKEEMGELPYLKFISCLASAYSTVCLIGSPAPENWMNDMKGEGKTVSMNDFLENDTPYCQVPVWYYGGTFGKGHDYGPSIIFALPDTEMLKRLPATFMASDAVALLLYKEGKDGMEAVASSLINIPRENTVIEALLQEARYLVISQADYQYLEVYTKAINAEDELKRAGDESSKYIAFTAWYQAHKDNLRWDELEMCLVRA